MASPSFTLPMGVGVTDLPVTMPEMWTVARKLEATMPAGETNSQVDTMIMQAGTCSCSNEKVL